MVLGVSINSASGEALEETKKKFCHCYRRMVSINSASGEALESSVLEPRQNKAFRPPNVPTPLI